MLGGLLATAGRFGPALISDSEAGGGGSNDTTAATTSTIGAPDENFAISEPRPDSIVTEDGFSVSGNSRLSVADSLWVVYRGITNSNPSFQPQEAPCSIATDGSFSCPQQYVGGSEEGGNRFELFFLVANQDAAQKFRDYAASDPAARGYPGLDSLPEGVRQVGSIIVERA